MSYTLAHAVTITKPGQAKGTLFKRTYKLPFPPQNGLRISLSKAASFIVEDLVFHVDTGTSSCRTSIHAGADRPMDDVLSYYQGLSYEVVK